MNIDDPKFTAYALNALPVSEKEAVEPGILADKELWREAEVTAAFAEKLKQAFVAEHNARLSDAHWREIFAEVGVEESPRVFPPERVEPRRLPVWALSAAAGVMAGAVISSIAITWGEHPHLLAESSPPKIPAAAEKLVPAVTIQAQATADFPVINQKEIAPSTQRSNVAFVPRPVGESVVASRTADTVVKVTPAFGGARNPIPRGIIPPVSVSVTGVLPVEYEIEPPQNVPVQSAAVVSIPIVSGIPSLVAPALPASAPEVAAVSIAASNVNNQKSVAATEVRKKSTFPQNLTGAVAAEGVQSGGARKPSTSNNDLVFSAAPASTRNGSNRVAPRIANAAEGPALGIAGTSQLNTLGDVNAVMEHDGALTASFAASDLILSGQGGVFSLRSNPDVKYTIVLDVGGIPFPLAPNSTAVLEVSAPFTIPSAP